jgi:hypothetical protein
MSSTLQPTAFLTGLLGEPLAGGIAILVGLTTLFGGAAHYGAVLVRQPKRTVEYATGLGFFTGMVIGIALLIFTIFIELS